jgi:hypothetical protein
MFLLFLPHWLIACLVGCLIGVLACIQLIIFTVWAAVVYYEWVLLGVLKGQWGVVLLL